MSDAYLLSDELRVHGHLLTQRVYYEDTDFPISSIMPVTCIFSSAVRLSALLSVDAEGLVFVVHRMEIDFKSSARMDDDVLTVLIVPEKAGGAKMVLDQKIRRGETLLIAAKVVIAVINAKGRPLRLPEGLAQNLSSKNGGNSCDFFQERWIVTLF